MAETSSTIKHMSAKDFRDLGLLLEVNRRVLHPLGLAMSVACDDRGNVVGLGPILDGRDDPEGFIFDPLNQEKVATVADMEAERRPAREQTLGYWIQPADGTD